MLFVASSVSEPERVLNTFSNGAFHVSKASAIEIVISLYSNAALSVTSPITTQSIFSSFTLSCATSQIISPKPAPNTAASSTLSQSFTPIWLPNAIFDTAAAIP